jgi:prepilin-type N-terminal cleavage/methylation domain-containing protein
MRKNNRKGFTIVELVIVIAVIAILAGVLIPTFASVVEKANVSNALQQAKNTYTEDLALLDAQTANYTKDEYKEYVDSADTTLVAGKTYYTKAEANGVVTYTAVASPENTAIATYYELVSICTGEFDGANYTVTIGDYTCTYANGEWDIKK